MKTFTAVPALLALIVVFVTLWHGSDGVVQISSPVRAQRSIYYHSRGKAGVKLYLFNCNFNVNAGRASVWQVTWNLTNFVFSLFEDSIGYVTRNARKVQRRQTPELPQLPVAFLTGKTLRNPSFTLLQSANCRPAIQVALRLSRFGGLRVF